MWIIGVPMLVLIGLFAAGCVIAAKEVASQWHSLNKPQRRHMIIVFGGVAMALVAAANYVAFFTISAAIGGDAEKVEGGRYYVASHGRLTEVSPEVWIYSGWHRTIT